MFGKLKSSSAINTNGIGLGLNICRQICEAFEGEISVESVEGGGSTFTFSIKTKTPRELKIEQIQLNIETSI
jgi:two-component system sensor histidine kinase/response regulator